MTKAELYEILANGENSSIEFKRDDVRPEQVAKECVAFLNFKGGKVLLGVEDDGQISGLTRANCQTWIYDTIFSRYIHPMVDPHYEEVKTEKGTVAVITLERGTAKPYVVRVNDREDVYTRVGDTSRIASREQLMRMMQEGDAVFHMETMPVNGTSMEDLDMERVRWYYEKFYGKLPNTKDEINHLLHNLDLAKKSSYVDSTLISIAGLILFGKKPSLKLPQAGLRIIVYPKVEVDLNANYDKLLDGPIVSISDDQGETVKIGLFNQIMDQLQSLLSEESLDRDGITRSRKWMYPPEVLRELLVNAFAHRDWTKFNTNKIEIFSDRLEITTAGALPNTMTPEKILAGVQYPRNPILVRVLRDLGEMDDRGMGFRRKVIPILKEHGFIAPQLEATEDYFKVTVFSKL